MTKLTSRIVLTAGAIVLGFAAQAATGEQGHKGGKADHRPSFAQLDANSDGQISKDEMQAHAAARFAKADTNGDGSLSAEELTARGHKRAERRAARMIDKLDSNGNGQIELSEMEARKGRHGKIFERLDANGDGTLSEEEFAKMEKRGKRRHKN